MRENTEYLQSNLKFYLLQTQDSIDKISFA